MRACSWALPVACQPFLVPVLSSVCVCARKCTGEVTAEQRMQSSQILESQRFISALKNGAQALVAVAVASLGLPFSPAPQSLTGTAFSPSTALPSSLGVCTWLSPKGRIPTRTLLLQVQEYLSAHWCNSQWDQHTFVDPGMWRSPSLYPHR